MAGPEAWEEISCNFLQVSLKSELQGLDGGLDGGPRFWIAVASQALTLCCFALFLLLEGLPLHVLILLGLTTGLDFVCTDQYQPSMPKISRQFGVDPEAVGSTIQVHLMSCALAMLCAGHWVRQRPATGGLIAWAFGSYGWQVSFLAVFGLTVLNTLANYLLLPDVRVDEEPQKAIQPQRDGVLRRQLLVLLGLSLLRGSSYVLMSVNGFIFEGYFLGGIRPAALMMSILVAARAFGMLASTTLGFSPVEALNLFSPLLLLAACYAAVVGAFMISDNPLTYMSGLALHQFLAHGPTWAVLAEAQKDPELDDAGLPPHIYAAIMNASACMLSLFGLSAISGGPSAVLYVIAIMSATSQACIRAGSLWAAAKQLAQTAFESTSDPKKPPPDD
ncbi:ydgK [Symbiodinium sp. CCMP2456]|nr:ydgK [Symbiodinium sp. CCMP2456]